MNVKLLLYNTLLIAFLALGACQKTNTPKPEETPYITCKVNGKDWKAYVPDKNQATDEIVYFYDPNIEFYLLGSNLNRNTNTRHDSFKRSLNGLYCLSNICINTVIMFILRK